MADKNCEWRGDGSRWVTDCGSSALMVIDPLSSGPPVRCWACRKKVKAIPPTRAQADSMARLTEACIDWNGVNMADGEPPRDVIRCKDLRDAVLQFANLKKDRDEAITRLIKLEALAFELFKASNLAIFAIDNILSCHEGQSEHAQLKEAFSALEAAINRYEPKEAEQK